MKKLSMLLVLACALPAAASTMFPRSVDCPVCLNTIWYATEASASIFDTGLDFKPLGAVSAPAALPVCRECGFVVAASSATSQELAAAREVTASEEYRALAGRASYYRLAWLSQKLDGNSKAALWVLYHRAAWQEASDPEKVTEDLRLALEGLEARIGEKGENDEAWPRMQYMRAEFLRRLSRFREARRVLDSLNKKTLQAAPSLKEFVKYQRVLCRRQDPAPRSLGEMKERGLGHWLKEHLPWPF